MRDVALVVGLLVSGGLWLAHVRFYGRLGLAPGDVGIGFGQVLERSIGALAFIAAMLPMIALWIALLAYPVLWLARRGDRVHKLVVRTELRDQAVVREGEWAIRAWIPLALGGPLLLFFVSENLTTTVVLAVLLLIYVANVRKSVLIVNLAFVRRSLAATALLTGVLAFAVLWLDAGAAAASIQDGKRVELEFLGVGSLAIRALPARVAIDGNVRCVLYLGSSEGAAALYDPVADQVELVPTGGLRVTLDPAMDRCPARRNGAG